MLDDLKTVQTNNIGDYATSIFVGENQNSYASEIKQSNGKSFNPALPKYYNQDTHLEKVCLTYFITILYEMGDLNILNINLLSMPNKKRLKVVYFDNNMSSEYLKCHKLYFVLK